MAFRDQQMVTIIITQKKLSVFIPIKEHHDRMQTPK